MKFLTKTGSTILVAVFLTVHAYADVSLTQETKNDRTYYRMDNGRVALVVDPSLGGAVMSYKDKLGGNVELVSNLAPRGQGTPVGLYIDHFQSQGWPGEMYDAKYEVTDQKKDAAACSISLRYLVTGQWGRAEDENLKDLILDKTYTLRADSPALECRIKFTAPAKKSKLFAYWQQHIFVAGGQLDRSSDKGFRPSTRGVRVKAGENWGHTGVEDFLRDFSDGWMALLDTQRKSGLVILSEYNELDVLYACLGNYTVEPMYRMTYLPATQSVEYVSWVAPVAGLDNVVAANPDYIAGYTMTTDGKGNGKVAFSFTRSVNAPKALSLKVSIMNALKPEIVVPAGAVSFDALDEKVQTKELAFKGAGEDPLVLKVDAEYKDAAGKDTTAHFEEYFNGKYQWAENIQTDMKTPVFRGERPKQKVVLRKPDPLKLKPVPGTQMWYAEGLMDDYYRVTPAAHMSHFHRDGGNLDQQDRVFISYSGLWQTRLSAFPYDYDQLLSYDIIILGGVKQEAFGNVGMEMMCDYLTAGGGMIVLGGPTAYGASRLRGTPLAELMPITMAQTPFDLEKLQNGIVKTTAEGASFLEDLDWSPVPRVLYLHKAEVKPWGKTVLEADGKPFLVIGETGPNKARVACILGAPMGNFGEKETPFYDWADWQYLMRQLNWWLMKDDWRWQK